VTRPFLHDDEEFEQLVRIVADQRGISEGVVEKDYWVTHALWWLKRSGLEIYFKGGTSLSKAFGLIHRFSEDVDLTIERGAFKGLPELGNLRSRSPTAVKKRRDFFQALESAMDISGMTGRKLISPLDEKWISVEIELYYPNHFALPAGMRPFIRLEPGLRPWKPPTVQRDLTSFLHDHLSELGLLGNYLENRPNNVPCVHPFLTMADKLDSVTKRYLRDDFKPEEFVRHYEDLAHLVDSADTFPTLSNDDRKAIIEQSLGSQDISASSPAFALDDDDRRKELERAHREIGPMFWGERIPLDTCCEKVSKWLEENPL